MSEIPTEIERLAEGCVRFVAQAVGAPLDGTQDTLPILDHYLKQAGAGAKREVEALVVVSAGAYFGEVLRMSLPGARWSPIGGAEADDPSGHRIELDHVFLAVDPFGLVRALLDDSVDPDVSGIVVRREERTLISDSLSRLGPVDEEDYRRLSVRFEVIEQCVAVLEGAAEARGELEQRFSRAAYAAILD